MWKPFIPNSYLPFVQQQQQAQQQRQGASNFEIAESSNVTSNFVPSAIAQTTGCADNSSSNSVGWQRVRYNYPRTTNTGIDQHTNAISTKFRCRPDNRQFILERLKEDEEMRRQVISKIIGLAKDNLQYFSAAQQQNGRQLSSHDWVFANIFVKQLDHLDDIGALVKKVETIAPHYDPGPASGCLPANGYRSVLSTVDACLERLHRLNERIKYKREDLVFFRRAATQHELSDCTEILVTMRAFLGFCLQIDAASEEFRLIPKFVSNPMLKGQQQLKVKNNPLSAENGQIEAGKAVDGLKPLIVFNDPEYMNRWITEVETIDQRCFYGRCAGFQYKQTLERIVTGFLVGMAAYSDGLGASTLPQSFRDGSISLTETIVRHQHGFTPSASPEPKTSKDVQASGPAEAEMKLASENGRTFPQNRLEKTQVKPVFYAQESGLHAKQQSLSPTTGYKGTESNSRAEAEPIPFASLPSAPANNVEPTSSNPLSVATNFFNTFFGIGSAPPATAAPVANNNGTLSTSPPSNTDDASAKRMGFLPASVMLATQLRSTTTSLLSTGKYIMQPDQRADQICRVTRYGDVNFIKSFWNIHENQLGHQLHDMVGPKIKTNYYFQIKHLPLKVRRRNKQTGLEEFILVDPPQAHAPPRPIKVRLLCNYAVDQLSDESQFQAGMLTKQTEAAGKIMRRPPSVRSPRAAANNKYGRLGPLTAAAAESVNIEMTSVVAPKVKTDVISTIYNPAAIDSKKQSEHGTSTKTVDNESQSNERKVTENNNSSASQSIDLMNHMINERRFSDTLIVHFHGGGFVAQSSKTHEIYLRGWAKELDVPILSVDYSLAPEYPYPRGFEECFFAYLWALENAAHLSSSAQRVIVCGDSAGGNMAIAVALKAIEMGLRAPDSILSMYPVLLVKYAPSPSRILALMDPILPIGVLTHCLAAYAGLEWMDPTHSWSQKDQQKPASPAPHAAKSADETAATGAEHSGLKHLQIITPRSSPLPPFSGKPDAVGKKVGFFTENDDSSSSSSNSSSDDAGNDAVLKTHHSASTFSPQRRVRSLARSHSDSELFYDADDEEATLAAATAATADGGGGGGGLAPAPSSVMRQRSAGSAANNAADNNNIKRDEFLNRRRRAQVASGAEPVSGTTQEPPNNARQQSIKRPLARLYVNGAPAGGGNAAESNDTDATSGIASTVSHDAELGGSDIQDRSASSKPLVGTMRRSQSERRNLPDSYRGRVSDGITHWRGFDADDRKMLENQQGSRKRLYEDYMSDVKKDYAVSHPTCPWLNMIAPLPRYSFEHVPDDFTLSPLLAPIELLKKLPPTKIIACELDPLLDDAVCFSRKMEYEVGNPISLTVVEGMPHGFLHLAMLSKEAAAGNALCIHTMKELIKRTPYAEHKPSDTAASPEQDQTVAPSDSNKLPNEMLTVGGDHREKLRKALEPSKKEAESSKNS